MIRFVAVLALITVTFTSTPAAPPPMGIEALSRWVMPLREKHNFELMPLERTRPIVLGDIVYSANLDGLVIAVHRTGGYVLWQRKLPAGVEGAFSYGRAKLIVGDLQGNLFALNARDGSVAWQFKIQSEWLSPPTVVRDRVLVSTSSDELYALTENGGKEIWHYQHRGDEKMTVRGSSGPTVFGDDVAIGFSDGSVASLDVAKGNVKWIRRLKSRDRFYDVDMTPFVDAKSVIAATYDGKLYSLDRESGEPQWSFPVGSYGGFLVEENRVYFSGLNGKVYGLDRANGEAVWSTEFGRGVGMAPARVGDALVVTTSADPVYVIDSKDGKILSTFRLGTGSLAAAVPADGWFYCLSNYGNLYSFELMQLSKLREPKTIESLSAVSRVLP